MNKENNPGKRKLLPTGKSLSTKAAALLTTAAALFMLLLSAGNTAAATVEELIREAMADLSVKKGSAELLVLTDAPYVTVEGASGIPYIEMVERQTGCSAGRGNLLFYQRSWDHPLRIALYEKTGGKMVVITRHGGRNASGKIAVPIETVSEKPFWKRVDKEVAGSDLFTLVTLSGAWALGAPADLLKCAELHNHLCPGLTSGYLIARMIREKYPLGEGEAYTMVSCPVWCKEDAFQVMLDCTPGKKGLVVKQLTPEQLKSVSVENPAGILLIHDRKTKKGRGIAISYDFDKVRKLVPPEASKAAMVFAQIPRLHEAEVFVSVAEEFALTPGMYKEIVSAGANPYRVAGLTGNH